MSPKPTPDRTDESPSTGITLIDATIRTLVDEHNWSTDGPTTYQSPDHRSWLRIVDPTDAAAADTWPYEMECYTADGGDQHARVSTDNPGHVITVLVLFGHLQRRPFLLVDDVAAMLGVVPDTVRMWLTKSRPLPPGGGAELRHGRTGSWRLAGDPVPTPAGWTGTSRHLEHGGQPFWLLTSERTWRDWKGRRRQGFRSDLADPEGSGTS